jgi:hypothetical protein
MVAAFALARGEELTGFGEALDPSHWRGPDHIGVILAALFVGTVIATIHVALGLVFDPRYKGFPLASLTGPVVAFAVIAFAGASAPAHPGRAEMAAAVLLAGSALYIIANEGTANWQALWFGGLLVILALTALRARALPG